MKKREFILVIVLLGLLVTLFACSNKAYMDEAILYVDNEMSDRGFEHGDIFSLATSYESVNISWESTDTIISSDGRVNAIGLKTDVDVKIIVTFSEGEEELIKDYYVTVYYIVEDNPDPDPDPITDPDEAKIKLIKDNLTLPSQVRDNLSLITESNGVMITWVSNNEAVITSEGIVTRSDTEDVIVELTATLTSNEKSDTKVFQITVEQIHVVAEAKEALEIVSETSENLDLPTTMGEEYVVNITWESDSDAINSEGVVTRSLTEDIEVTLTATLTYEDDSDTKTFTVRVLQDLTLNNVVESLTIETTAVRDLLLPSLIDNVIIEWTSSMPMVISPTGEVTRSTEEAYDVTLNATLHYQGQMSTKSFDVTVPIEPTQKLSRAPMGFVWQPNFYLIAYAPYASTGYSGYIMGTFVADGYDTVVITMESLGGRFDLYDYLDQFVPGINYSATFIALGDGIDYADSDPSAPLMVNIPIDYLDAFTNIMITDGVLTFDPVLEAESYEIYISKNYEEEVLVETLLPTDTLAYTLSTEAGNYDIRIVAKADGRGDSEGLANYMIEAEEAIELDAPVIQLDAENNIISWEAINHAVAYEVTVGEKTMTTTDSSFNLILITNMMGDYDVSVKAIGDGIFYSQSVNSNVISYTINVSLEKVSTDGILFQTNVNGHYSIEKPANVNPVGWASGEYIVEIYKDDVLVSEKTLSNTGTVVHIQTPNNSSGMFYDLDPGEYEVHVILVGNGTTHIDSDPKVFIVDYAGYE